VPETTIGLVTRQDGPRFWVETEGREVACILRGRLRQEQARASSPAVIGDRVLLRVARDGTAVIEAVEPRRSELSRPGPRGIHVMAANVDLLVIVQAARQPPFQRRLVERFLATAHRGRMEAVVVVNKCDLEREEVIRGWLSPLEEVPVLLTSAADRRGIEALRALLRARISVLAGKSGTGKSSLLNAMYPGFAVRTGAVSEKLNKGRHTTTASRLYPLPGGGYLADTPGIRTLGLFADDQAVSGVFPEISAAAEGCRFRDCTHSHEAACAVKAAVDGGEIDADRYRNYLRLARGG